MHKEVQFRKPTEPSARNRFPNRKERERGLWCHPCVVFRLKALPSTSFFRSSMLMRPNHGSPLPLRDQTRTGIVRLADPPSARKSVQMSGAFPVAGSRLSRTTSPLHVGIRALLPVACEHGLLFRPSVSNQSQSFHSLT